MTTSGDPLVISTAEAAELLGVDPATVTRWAIAGKLPVLRKMPGRGAYIFSRDAVVRHKTLLELLRTASEGNDERATG